MPEFLANGETVIKARRPSAHYPEVVAQNLRPLMGPALALAAVVLGAGAGLLATKLPLIAVLIMLGGAAIALIALSRPEFVILLMLVISSSVISPKSIPSINVGFNFTAVEMCLMLLLGLVVVRSLADRTEPGFVRTPLDLPILLFFVVSIISFFNALYNLGEPRGWLVPQWRVLFDYLVFFAVTNLIRTRRQLMTLAGGMLVMATVIAALMAAQAAVGTSVRLIPYATIGTSTAFGQEFAGVNRVLPPGKSLVFIMLFPVLILYTTSERLQTRRWLLSIPLLLFLVAIAVTFTRALWIGTTFSLIMLPFISPVSQRQKLLTLICGLVVVFSLSALFLNAYFPQRMGNFVDALSLRAGTLFAGGDRLKQDQERRLCEIESAKIKILEHPLLGVGPGGELHTKMCTERLPRFVHNSYAFILADLGLLGFLPFLWFSAAYLFRGFLSGRTLKDPVLKGWVLGLTLAYVVLLIASVAEPEFMYAHTVPVIGVMLGVNEVALRLGQSPA
jgi:hypothetical protein